MMDNFLMLLQKGIHEEMKFEEELKEKSRKKSDDDHLNLSLFVTAGAAIASLNS